MMALELEMGGMLLGRQMNSDKASGEMEKVKKKIQYVRWLEMESQRQVC